MMQASDAVDRAWWRSAVIYQVYIRSFADADGDGLGDIDGLRAHLGHIAGLGVDAIWINPWYPSPMADAGYDVSDHRAIEPRFGSMEGAEALIAEAHDRGLRVLLDLVPNHASSEHVWFQAALAAGPGSPERERFLFRDGSGPDGAHEPNDWESCFGGTAWTRVVEADGRPGQWYAHLFAPEQPDFDWNHPDVRKDFEATLRAWFDRGVDGFRIDVAHSLIKEPGLPDIGDRTWKLHAGRVTPIPGVHQTDHPHWDRDEVHDVYRSWRAIADTYDPPRIFVAEAVVPDVSRMARYLRYDELHTAFNFDFLKSPWQPDLLRAVIDDTLREHADVGAPATWVLSNHDVARHVSRYARVEQVRGVTLSELRGEVDLALGARRARAAALLMFALPGVSYVYQGDELGLPEVEDLPDECLQDPTWERTEHTDRGRDGCRVPIPWSGTTSPFGFSPDGADEPWLPQPDWFVAHTVEALEREPDSMLHLYRDALRIRRGEAALHDTAFAWLDSPDGVLVFARGDGFACVVNMSPAGSGVVAAMVADGWRVVLASGPITDDGVLPPETAMWLRRT